MILCRFEIVETSKTFEFEDLGELWTAENGFLSNCGDFFHNCVDLGRVRMSSSHLNVETFE